MNRVYVNIGIGLFWLFAIGLLYLSGNFEIMTVAVCIIMACLFFWSAFKIYLNPQLAKKNKKNLVKQLTEQNSNKKSEQKK